MIRNLPGEKPPVVLVVDDDVTVRLLARESMEQAGFTVQEAEDGTLALAAYELFRPEIVLLDVMLPGKDGFTVCAEIREFPGGDDTQILMMTGLDDIIRRYDPKGLFAMAATALAQIESDLRRRDAAASQPAQPG